ncbi:MAG: ADP-ribosylglycohydrolase family protein [Phycisphaerae bacterium]|nr:ADP-ribosylglycohydrolase family protein [Phycisphaerae bacterium]
MRLNRHEYRSKVLGCWLGKNIGGTVGAPFEWKRQVNDISFYVQGDLNGRPLPNDDLDIQLLWLCAMEEKGLDVTSQRLADYWCRFVTPHWAEYGNAKVAMRHGLLPPLSGSVNNAFKHSCGAYIRSEIWACIAPGLPQVAASYAVRDAALDHGDGEGTHAEVFMAALESAAFVVSDLRALIDIALTYVPADSGVAAAVRTTLACHDAGKSWLETRDDILRHHRGRLADFWPVSDRDRALGFDTGVFGYDVPSNIALTLVGLLWGGEDFGQVMCIAVNCGEDTDCTAATAGSIWGIIHGAEAVPQKWIDPIGRGIATIVLNLGELWHLPKTVDELTDRTQRLARQMLIRHHAEHLHSDEPTDLGDLDPAALRCRDLDALTTPTRGPLFTFDFFSVQVLYGEGGPAIRDGQTKDLTVTIQNLWWVQTILNLRWYLPDTLHVAPARQGTLSFVANESAPKIVTFQLTAGELREGVTRAVLEITADSRPTVMLVPVMFTNGNFATSDP